MYRYFIVVRYKIRNWLCINTADLGKSRNLLRITTSDPGSVSTGPHYPLCWALTPPPPLHFPGTCLCHARACTLGWNTARLRARAGSRGHRERFTRRQQCRKVALLFFKSNLKRMPRGGNFLLCYLETPTYFFTPCTFHI